jgi:RNA polymerase sigma-70 factor (sigma-E family)
MLPMTTEPRPPTGSRAGGAAGIDLDALHRRHYADLVRLASFLIDDVGRCEELVQEAFVRLAARPGAVREPDRVPAYLRSAVLNGARSVLRRKDPGPRLRLVASTAAGPEQPDAAAARRDDEAAVLAALRSLPHRQQSVLVLRYWLDLPEAEIAETLGIGAGTVKTHARRGLAALAARLEPRDA